MAKRRDTKFYKWVESTLVNNESSSDRELKEYFMKEGKMTEKEATFYIKQRDGALMNPLGFNLKKR